MIAGAAILKASSRPGLTSKTGISVTSAVWSSSRALGGLDVPAGAVDRGKGIRRPSALAPSEREAHALIGRGRHATSPLRDGVLHQPIDGVVVVAGVMVAEQE